MPQHKLLPINPEQDVLDALSDIRLLDNPIAELYSVLLDVLDDAPEFVPVTCERILIAALYDGCGNVYTGYRHSDIYFDTDLEDKKGVVEGFLTSKNQFVTRKEAWVIADNAGQIINRSKGIDGLLFSENLY